jgi:hypothetical protein
MTTEEAVVAVLQMPVSGLFPRAGHRVLGPRAREQCRDHVRRLHAGQRQDVPVCAGYRHNDAFVGTELNPKAQLCQGRRCLRAEGRGQLHRGDPEPGA